MTEFSTYIENEDLVEILLETHTCDSRVRQDDHVEGLVRSNTPVPGYLDTQLIAAIQKWLHFQSLYVCMYL